MIPLIKPLMAPLGILSEYLETPYDNGTWSNFGPLHFSAARKLQAITGKFPVIVNSATSALDLAVSLTMPGAGLVAVPDYTHAGSVVPILNNAAQPLIISCERETMAADRKIFSELCWNGDIDGAVIVNPFGYGIDRKFYAETARQYNIPIVFDYAGAWGDFDIDDEFPTVYSFHATKSLPIGEGGVLLFSTEEEALRARRRSNFSTMPDRMIEDCYGQNFKMSELQAAMLCAQLDSRQYPVIAYRIENRRKLFAFYQEELKRPQREVLAPSLCVFPFPEMKPSDFESFATGFGFTAKQYYIPLRSMPGYMDVELEGRFCPELDRCVALPSDCTMEEAQQIVECIRRFLPE